MDLENDQMVDADLGKNLKAQQAIFGSQSGDIAVAAFGDHEYSNVLDDASHTNEFDFDALFDDFLNPEALDGLDGQLLIYAYFEEIC